MIDDSILAQDKTFQVIKKINHMMLSKHKRTSNVKTRGKKGKCFGFFEKKYFEVKLALDCIHLTNYNSHINFVLHLNKEVIRSWSFLDVSLKMRLEIAKENEPGKWNFIEKVIYFDTFDLWETIPNNNPSDIYEMVQNISLKKFHCMLNTIDSRDYKLKYFVNFHFSEAPFKFKELAFE